VATLPVGSVTDITTVRPGDSLTLRGVGFVPGEEVQALMASQVRVLGVATAEADGSMRVDVRVPDDADLGEHTLALYAPGSGRGERQGVTVLAAGVPLAPGSTSEVLPATGGPLQPVVVAMLVVLAGLAIVSPHRGGGRFSRAGRGR
jgi:hypothetical protein